MDLYQPLPGNYEIYLYSLKDGGYQAPLRAFLTNGSSGTPLTLQGTQTAHTLTAYQVNFGAGGLTSQSFTNAYVWSASPTNGSLPLSVQFNAPATDTAGNTVTNWFWDLGNGTFTFYGGHDPEDFSHAVGDPPTDLALHKNSPGYRLILNNVLFPAAKKKKLKT